MKVGFTGIERNIYGLKKRKNISFKATNSITEDKKIKPEEKNSEEAAKRKKMIIAGTLTAVAVPATIVALAMLGAKGKKKVNTSSIAKIEKEITQSDLLKETQEIAKILKVYNKTKQISFNDAANLTKALTAYNKTLKKVFGPQITKNILPNIDKITGILSKYLNEEKNKASKQSFTTATAGFKEAITNL